MKEILKGIVSSCLGFFLAIIGIFFLFLIIGSITLVSNKPETDSGVLLLDINKSIPELTGNEEISPFDLESEPSVGLRDIQRLIENAKTDETVHGIMLNGADVSLPPATLSIIREALLDFKTSGKPIFAYSDYFTQAGYHLATAADSIFLNPNGAIDLKGFGVMIPFYKGLLDKMGITMNVFYAGNFKSATEPFRRTDISEENRLQTKEFLGDILDQLVEDIAVSRNLKKDQVHEIIETLAGRKADLALESGLIDGITYQDQVDKKWKKALGDKEAKLISLSKYALRNPAGLTVGQDRVAVVFAEGEIGYGENKKGIISDKKYLRILKKIREDEKVKAVVLRVNSPGGSALTSDVIWREIELLKEKGIPVYASFGAYAASGGYYIAAGCDKIYAQENTLTGSIGVFSILPNARKFFNDKLGISFDTIKTHSNAVGISPFFDVNAKENEFMMEMTDQVYTTFIDRVATGRNLPIDSVKNIAQGRVYSGKKAIKLGLVDEIGTLDDVIKAVAQKAGLPDSYKVVNYPEVKENPFTEIVNMIRAASEDEPDESVKIFPTKVMETYDLFNQFHSILKEETPQARLPFVLKN